MKTHLTIGKSCQLFTCHSSESTSDIGVTNNICYSHLSDKSEASMNWIKKQPVEHFDFLALLVGVRAYIVRLPDHLVGGSGCCVHCVTNQLHLEWKLFTDSHILIYFHCTASNSS